eukprot:COSAG02_NODE_606_length_19624_cov_33.479846_5_plen_143_part_00
MRRRFPSKSIAHWFRLQVATRHRLPMGEGSGLSGCTVVPILECCTYLLRPTVLDCLCTRSQIARARGSSSLSRTKFRSMQGHHALARARAGMFRPLEERTWALRSSWVDYDYDLLQVHVVIPLATCLRNGYAIPLGYAEFSV